MSWMLPLPVVIPLLGAAVNALLDHVSPKWLHNAVTVTAVASSFAFSIVIMLDSMSSEPVHWFGGWRPRHGIPLGINFAADPLGAGMAALSSGLVCLVLVYSWA